MSACICRSFSGSTTSTSTSEITTDAILGAMGTSAGTIGARDVDMMPLQTIYHKGGRSLLKVGDSGG